MCVPVGTVISYLGQEGYLRILAKDGWLLCDGSLVSTTDYPDLLNAIGTFYGGSTDTFALPDLRGVFLRGVDTIGTCDPDYKTRASQIPFNLTVVGPVVGSRQADQLRSHQHNWDQNFGQITASGHDLNVQLAQNSPHGNNNQGSDQPTTNVDGGGNETRPANVYCYWLIFAGSPSSD